MRFDTSGLLPLSDALQGMLDQLACCCDREQLPLPQALGRILASDIASPLAVRLADLAAGIPLIMAGKPFAFGLPGNPVSAMVTFDQLVQPALAKLAG